VRNVPKRIGEPGVELFGKKCLSPIRIDEVQKGIAEVCLVGIRRELCRHEIRWKKWCFGNGHLHAKKKASREADLLFAC
jgi:hypothetical protein